MVTPELVLLLKLSVIGILTVVGVGTETHGGSASFAIHLTASL
jgi:hypothetical protein